MCRPARVIEGQGATPAKMLPLLVGISGIPFYRMSNFAFVLFCGRALLRWWPRNIRS
jgi:hypothetical protein